MGGMLFYGGLFGVMFFGYIFCWRNKLDFLKMGDFVVVVVFIGLFFGCIVNFINGEFWGK